MTAPVPDRAELLRLMREEYDALHAIHHAVENVFTEEADLQYHHSLLAMSRLWLQIGDLQRSPV